MGALLQASVSWFWVLPPLVVVAIFLWLLPRRRERRRRLGAIVTLLRGADPRVRIETLERAHALAPGDRTLVARMLRKGVSASRRAGSTTSPAQAMTVWLIRQILGLLGDARTNVRTDAARVLRAILSGQLSQVSREREDATPLATPVTAAVELAGGRILSGSVQSRQQTRVLAFAEMLEAGLRPLVVGIRALEGVQEEALEPLTSALRDRSPRVRQSLCEVLAAIGGERAIELLVPLLQDPSPELRVRAAQALGSLKATAVSPQLTELLRDPIPQVRAAAASALAELKAQAACGPLVAALIEESRREDGAEATRMAMLEAAAQLADGGQAELARAFASLSAPVAHRLATALERNGAIERWLTQPHWGDRAELLSGLLGSAAVLGVTRSLLGALDLTEEWARLRAAAALGHTQDPAALTALTPLLNDPGATVRAAAVTAIAKPGAPLALAPLARAATDPDRAVALAAIGGLQNVLQQRSAWKSELLPPDFDLDSSLVECQRALLVAAGNTDERMRARAAQALAVFASAEAASALVDLALSDVSEVVREAATQALVQCAFPHRRRLLAGGLEDHDEARRARALVLLGALGGPEAGRQLIDALHDSATKVREAALAALSRYEVGALKERLLPELRNADPRVRAQVAAQLGRARATDCADALAQALADPEEEVRVNALGALATLGRPVRKHRSLLTARLSDPSPRVRDAAATALGALREAWAEATEAAELILHGSLSGAAAAAVVEMAVGGDLDPLLRALDNPQSAQSLAAFLAGSGRTKMDSLLPSLRQAEERDQMRAIAGLSQALRQTGAANGYLSELKAIDPGARLMAVEIAGLLGTPAAMVALIEVLERDPLPEVRMRAATALAESPDEAAEAALRTSQTQDPNEAVRHVAARALSRRQTRQGGAAVFSPGAEAPTEFDSAQQTI